MRSLACLVLTIDRSGSWVLIHGNLRLSLEAMRNARPVVGVMKRWTSLWKKTENCRDSHLDSTSAINPLITTRILDSHFLATLHENYGVACMTC